MKTEEMKLPPGWVWTTMGDIANVVGGGTPKTKVPTNYEGGTIPWLTPADLSGYTAKYVGHGARYITQKGLDSSSAKMMPTGTVLFTSRAPIGYVAIASNPICTNQGFKSFVLRDGILPEYVYWWLKGSKELAESMASGTTFLELSGAKAKQLPIPIAPLDQQKRIVAEIEKQFSRLDEAVANLKRVKANLKRYKAAVLKAAVEGKLTEEWRKAHPDAEPASKLLDRIRRKREQWIKDAVRDGSSEAKRLRIKLNKHSYAAPEGWSIPGNWSWSSFLEANHRVVDCHNKTAPYQETGIPLLRTTNIRDGKIDIKNARRVSDETYQYWSRRCPPMPGDILFTREAPMGEAAIVPQGETVCMGQRMMLLRPYEDDLKASFLLIVLLSPMFQAHLRMSGVGSGVKHLRVGDVESLPVPVPPLDEQEAILKIVENQLTTISETEIDIETNLARADHLRHSIISAAFCGDLGDKTMINANGYCDK